jgi:outer membrane protein W
MKTLFTGILLGIGSVVLAQTQKGQTLTSGTFGLSFGSSKSVIDQNGVAQAGNQSTAYEISSQVNRGMFIRDGLLLGYNLGIFYRNSSSDNAFNGNPASFDGKYSSGNYSLGVSLRKYWPVTDLLFVYAGGGLGFTTQQYTYSTEFRGGVVPETVASRNRYNFFQPSGQVGAMYRVSNRLALQAGMSSNGFPINVSTASFGLVLLSGPSSGTLAAEPMDASQTRKGRWVVGASASINSTFNEQERATVQTGTGSSATTGLAAGWFVRDNVLLGLAVDYTANRSGGVQAPGPVNYTLVFSPFVRSYLGQNRLRPYWQAGASYSTVNNALLASTTTNQAGLGLSGGVAYMLGERFIIQTSLGTFDATYRWSANTDFGQRDTNVNVAARGSLLSGFALYYVL